MNGVKGGKSVWALTDSLRTSYARNTRAMTAEVVAVYEKVFATQ
jgi:hypothetical protein